MNDAAGYMEGPLPFHCEFYSEVPISFFEEALMFSAPSYLIDRKIQRVEKICLPRVQRSGLGRPLHVWIEDGTAYKTTSWKRKLQNIATRNNSAACISSSHDYVIDFRKNTPGNWSHMLNDYLPMLFHILDKLNISVGEFEVILPKNIQRYITSLFDLMEINYLCYDGPVIGRLINFEIDPWWSIRNMQYKWAHNAVGKSILVDKVKEMPGLKNVFISRRKLRSLENELIIEEFLGKLGFIKIYAEDFQPVDQLGIIASAENIVAIHGAALAPVLYHPSSFKSPKVIELFPCGHVERSFQSITLDVGGAWACARGRIKPSYISGLYNDHSAFTKYSNDSFYLDVRSLEMAMSSVEMI